VEAELVLENLDQHTEVAVADGGRLVKIVDGAVEDE
jgi:hypothetical protein